MNYRFKLFGLGLLIISGGAQADLPCQTPEERVDQAAILQKCGLRYVNQAHVQRESLNYDSAVRVFSIVRLLSLGLLVGGAGSNFYNWCYQIQNRSVNERLLALEKQSKQPVGKAEPQGWVSSIGSFAQGIFSGVPMTLGSTIVSSAAVGLLTSTIPVSELAKSEPSYKWFLNYKTGFLSECGLLLTYVDRQQVIHDAFCLETTRLVLDVEKILGYVAYQIRKIKKRSSMAAKVLESRSEQLRTMTNELVDLVAQEEYGKMVVELRLLIGFVNEGLAAGILD